jgi:benzil reductase ((S)-benzoin forming)
MEKILIVTGGSKGIGEGLVKAYLDQGFKVFSIARTTNALLTARGVSQIKFDLSKTYEIEEELSKIFALLNADRVSKITLINNAGTLGKIGPVDKLDVGAIEEGFTLNIVAPFVLSAAFTKLTRGWIAKKTIINITSGAATKPYFGWSVYCSSKAALNMFTQTMAEEQIYVENSVRVLAIAPGVVDTEMQNQIRNSTVSDFKSLDRFVKLKAEGGLSDTNDVGKQICEIDFDQNVVGGTVLRLGS